MPAKRTRRYIRLGLAIFWLGIVGWQLYALQAAGFDESILEGDERVRVDRTDGTLVFTPTVDTTASALLFFPGALVDPKAYAPMAYDLAAKGHRVVLVTVPLRLAFMTWQAEKVWSRTWAALEANPSRRWVVGGHSRGGRMAAEFVHEYPEEVAGLLLVGTSHPRRLDLSHERLAVLKVYGSEDGLASEEEIDQFASNLPDHTEWVRVEGGNHAHFAWYGFQFGDGSAHIARADQHRQLVQATDAFLNKLDRADAFLMRPTDEGESR